MGHDSNRKFYERPGNIFQYTILYKSKQSA